MISFIHISRLLESVELCDRSAVGAEQRSVHEVAIVARVADVLARRIQGFFQVCSMPRAHTEFGTANARAGPGRQTKGRNAMKRSFQVATVFTGAAACAVALTPTAEAAPAAPGATTTITPKTITANNCTAGEWNWLHMYYTAAENHPTPACFGGTGVFKIAGNKRFTKFCPGDNSGAILTSRSYIPFSAEGVLTFLLHSAIVYSVYISAHNNPSASC
jgi:hypothetical protein